MIWWINSCLSIQISARQICIICIYIYVYVYAIYKWYMYHNTYVIYVCTYMWYMYICVNVYVYAYMIYTISYMHISLYTYKHSTTDTYVWRWETHDAYGDEIPMLAPADQEEVKKAVKTAPQVGGFIATWRPKRSLPSGCVDIAIENDRL